MVIYRDLESQLAPLGFAGDQEMTSRVGSDRFVRPPRIAEEVRTRLSVLRDADYSRKRRQGVLNRTRSEAPSNSHVHPAFLHR